MIPNLSLLPVFSGARTPLQTPKQIEELRRWLTRQEAEELPDHLQRLHDSIIAQQQDVPKPSIQLSLLRCYLSHVQKASRELRASNYALALPLPAETVQQTQLLNSIYLHMANAYKTVVLQAADDNASNNILDATELAVACYGSLHYLAQALYTAYQGYHPYAEGTWYEIHQLYQFARAEEIVSHPVRSFSVSGKDTDSFLNAYKRVLLLELADPYRMQYGIVDGVYKALHEWVDKIAVTDSVPTNAKRCKFLTDLEFDKAGIPLLPRTAFQPGPRHLVINTAELVSELHQQYEATEGMPDHQQRELLRSLIVQWGVQPMRSMERKPVKKDCEIIVGMDSIDFMVGLDKFDKSDHSDAAAKVVADAKDDPDYPDTTHWEIVDESPGGMQIVASGKADTRITVGEIIGVRLPSLSLRWQIGTVRWVKHHDKSRSNLGINILGISTVQVHLKPVDADANSPFVETPFEATFDGDINERISDPELGSFRATLLETPGDNSSESRLVVRTANFKEGMVFTVIDSETRYQIRLDKVLAAARHCDCFTFTRIKK